MAINPYVFGPAKVNATTLAVTDLGLELVAGSDLVRLQHSANRFMSVIVRASGEPRVRFSTPAAGALALFGTDGIKVTTLEVWMAKFADFRKTGTSSDDDKIDFNTNAVGFGYIEGISAGQGGIALASVVIEVLLGTATTVDPLKFTSAGGDIPVLGSEPALHTVGPIAINGTRIDGVRSTNLSFGHSMLRLAADGDVYARVGALTTSDPTLSAEVVNPDAWLTSAGVIGAPITTSMDIWFRAFKTDQTLDTVGFKLASGATSGRYMIDGASGRPGETVTAALSATFISSTDTNPWTYTASGTVP